MSDRRRLTIQFIVAAVCLIGGLIYPISLAIAELNTAGQVSPTGMATAPVIYNPPVFYVIVTFILLPIGVIVGFASFVELSAIRKRNQK
jgi:hypothetical protein